MMVSVEKATVEQKNNFSRLMGNLKNAYDLNNPTASPYSFIQTLLRKKCVVIDGSPNNEQLIAQSRISIDCNVTAFDLDALSNFFKAEYNTLIQTVAEDMLGNSTGTESSVAPEKTEMLLVEEATDAQISQLQELVDRITQVYKLNNPTATSHSVLQALLSQKCIALDGAAEDEPSSLSIKCPIVAFNLDALKHFLFISHLQLARTSANQNTTVTNTSSNTATTSSNTTATSSNTAVNASSSSNAANMTLGFINNTNLPRPLTDEEADKMLDETLKNFTL